MKEEELLKEKNVFKDQLSKNLKISFDIKYLSKQNEKFQRQIKRLQM